MPMQVVNGATLMCSFGTTPSTFVVLPIHRVYDGGQPAANITDHKPMLNIMPFGMCVTPSNPAVAAAQGVPQPCIPMTNTPWVTGAPTVILDHQPALDNISKCFCQWGGCVSIVNPGQTTTFIP